MVDPSFANDIKPLFGDEDRSSMQSRLDLRSGQGVRDNVAPILDALWAGTIPGDGPWSSDKVDRFAGWIASGTAD